MVNNDSGLGSSNVRKLSPDKQKLVDLVKATLEGLYEDEAVSLGEKRRTLIEIMPEEDATALWVTCEDYRKVVDPKIADGAVIILTIVFKFTEFAVSQAMARVRIGGEFS
jgi:hypothetical protein